MTGQAKLTQVVVHQLDQEAWAAFLQERTQPCLLAALEAVHSLLPMVKILLPRLQNFCKREGPSANVHEIATASATNQDQLFQPSKISETVQRNQINRPCTSCVCSATLVRSLSQ